MTPLDQYLEEHFIKGDEFARRCDLTTEELDGLIERRLIPEPSYTVSKSSVLCSCVFGELEAPGAVSGRYFRPEQAVWTSIAQGAINEHRAHCSAHLKERFAGNYQRALGELNTTTHRLELCFDDQGAPISEGLDERTENIWMHFLRGTFGLCVANPVSEYEIARKGVLQQKLTEHTENGARTAYTPEQAKETLGLIDTYAKSSMPFSPIEYPLSSKKRLVDDLRVFLESIISA